MELTHREQFKAIARFQRKGDLLTTDMVWPETLSQWVKQGAPKELASGSSIYADGFFKNYFHHYGKIVMGEIKSGFSGGEIPDIGYGIPTIDGSPLVPGFTSRIISEDEHSLTYIDGGGRTLKAMKNKPFSMPMFLDWPVKDRASWKELKKRLDPKTPERWPIDWDAYVKEMNSQTEPVALNVGGFYGYLREWLGTEEILYKFHDDPNLIVDMMDQLLYMELEVIKRVVKDIKVDEADFLEDLAYKAGPFISPDMIKKFLMPRYKKITDLLHSNGVDIIYVDSDGFVEPVVPLWLESGVNYVWPLEQAAGNDAVALRKKYGENIILSGAIDKRALIKGKDAIKAEVMSKVPFLLSTGGYFPTVDHLVSPDITYENYCYYINLLREVAGLEKLSFG